MGEELSETHQKAEEARGKGSTGRDSRFGLARPVLLRNSRRDEFSDCLPVRSAAKWQAEELPAFCKKIRRMFTKTEIERYFETSELDSRIDSDLFVGANAEETAELQEIVDDAKRDRERRSWVKAMLTQSGS